MLDPGSGLPEQEVQAGQEWAGRAEPSPSICSALILCSLGLFFFLIILFLIVLMSLICIIPHNAAQQDFCSELLNRGQK